MGLLAGFFVKQGGPTHSRSDRSQVPRREMPAAEAAQCLYNGEIVERELGGPVLLFRIAPEMELFADWFFRNFVS